MYIYRSACLYCQTIQPDENIGDVLHDENVNHIVLRTKLNIISLPERNKAIRLT
jgi:acyl-ACP thioesterase